MQMLHLLVLNLIKKHIIYDPCFYALTAMIDKTNCNDLFKQKINSQKKTQYTPNTLKQGQCIECAFFKKDCT